MSDGWKQSSATTRYAKEPIDGMHDKSLSMKGIGRRMIAVVLRQDVRITLFRQLVEIFHYV